MLISEFFCQEPESEAKASLHVYDVCSQSAIHSLLQCWLIKNVRFFICFYNFNGKVMIGIDVFDCTFLTVVYSKIKA